MPGKLGFRHGALVVGLMSAASGLVGCLFQTRTPESSQGVQVCYETVASKTYDLVFDNLDGSLGCEQSASYADQLADDFTFEPTPEAQADYPDVFSSPWTKDEEVSWLGSVFSLADSVEANLRVSDNDVPSGSATEILVDANYRVRVVESGGSVQLYTGRAQYTLVQRATVWYLQKWVDLTTEGTSLGQLRGAQGGGS